MEIMTKGRFIRVAPDKIRILATLIKNQTIAEAITRLRYSEQGSAKSVIFVLKQVMAQIKDKNAEINDFKIKSLQVNEGPKLKRRRIIHQGRATAILKRMSHIVITLDDNKDSKLPVDMSEIKTTERSV